MKARHRTPFKGILFLGLLASLFIAYLHYGLFPGRLKPYASEKINEITQLHIEFEKILVLPFQGLSLHDLRVYDKAGIPLFSAKKLAVNVRLLPFLREKKIVVNNVYLESPVYDYVMAPKKIKVAAPPPMTELSGQIRVPTAADDKKVDLETLAEGPDFFLPDNVYLEQIEIENGFVSVRRKPGEPVIEEIQSINVRMAFQKPPDLMFDGFIRLGADPYAQVSLKGAWNLKTGIYAFYLQTKADKVPAWLLEYQKNNFLILKKGRLRLETQLKSTNDGQAFFHTQAQLHDSLIKLRSAEYSGRMDLTAKGLFDFNSKSIRRYQGSLNLIGVNVEHLSDKIPELKNLKGRILFQPDLLTLDGVAGQYKNISFKAVGTLKSFKDLLLNISVYTDSKISEVLSLLSAEQRKLIGKLQIQGNCQAATTIQGTLRKPKELRTGYKVVVRDGSIMSPDKKLNLSQVAAQIAVDDHGLRISQCGFTLANKRFALDATIPKAEGATRTLNLVSKDFTIDASYLMTQNTFVVKKATARSAGASAVFHGSVSNISNPFVDIAGRSEIVLNRMKPLLQTHAPAIKDLPIDGVLSGPFTLKGLWNKPADWDLAADLHGNTVFVKKSIRLDNFEFQLRMKNKMLNIPYLRANAYQGITGVNAIVDLSSPSTPFNGKIFANNVDLRPLLRDIDPKQKDISGIAILQAVVKGRLKSQESYTGSGSLNIRNGKLWKTDLFKAMGKLPLLKVEGLDEVTFHDLNGTFEIRDKKLWTKNLSLYSDTVDLSLEGSIGFDQSLDLFMDIQYSNNVRLGAMDTGGLAPFIVDQVGDLISQYRITGTLSKPVYGKAGLPVARTVGKKISGFLGV